MDIDPALFETAAARRACRTRDVTALYQVLRAAGMSHRAIAAVTGQSPSEVCEILTGRRVMGYDVLVRICEGLGIPRGYMGLAYDATVTEDDNEIGDPEVDKEVKRRALLGRASVALFGAPVLGAILDIPVRRTATPLPSRLFASDVAALRGCTQALRDTARMMGGGGATLSEVAHKSMRLLAVPASEQVEKELKSAIADLHTEAGWTCVDSGLHDHARTHFAQAMEQAHSAGHEYGLANTFRHAGIQMMDAGAHNDALKAFQLGMTVCNFRNTEMMSWLTAESAYAYAALGHREEALRSLNTARQFSPTDPFDDAEWDYLAWKVHECLGQTDTAARFAQTAVRKWTAEGRSARDSVESDIALATLHVTDGSSDGSQLAHAAISKVAQLSSVRARQVKLPPLVSALIKRGNSDLARAGSSLINSASST